MFNSTLIYDEASNHVYYGKFSPRDGLTAHKRMFNKVYPNPTKIRNVSQIYGESMKENGRIEMSSGTLNIVFDFESMRSRDYLIPKVRELIYDLKRCSKVSDKV